MFLLCAFIYVTLSTSQRRDSELSSNLTKANSKITTTNTNLAKTNTVLENRKPIIYPPVVPARTPIPPENPANTGTPIAPSRINTNMESVPLFPPRTPTATKTPNVCSVNGTAAGMDIQEQIAIITANTAMYTIS